MKTFSWAKIVVILLVTAISLSHFNAPAQSDVEPSTNIDWSSASDAQVILQGIELTTPLSADQAPLGATYYSALHSPISASPWPPLPANVLGLPVWDLGDHMWLIDDISEDYSAPMAGGRMMAMDGLAPPGSGGTNIFSPSDNFMPFDPGTNLWIAQEIVSNGSFSGILSNTVPDIEYQLLSANALDSTQWVSQSFMLGSEITNWTPWSVPFNPATNFFLNAVSWRDDSGTGIPDWWWTKYDGQYSNVNANALDPAGDGWTYAQKFAMGVNPNVFATPPPPQNFTVFYNGSNNTASLNWHPNPGPVINYTILRASLFVSYNEADYFTTSSTNFVDTSIPSISPKDLEASGPEIPLYYQVQANYPGGSSSWSYQVWPDNLSTQPNGNIVEDSGGNAYLEINSLPANTVALRITRVNQAESEAGDGSYNTNFDIPIGATTNGLYAIQNYFDQGDEPGSGYGNYEYGSANYEWYFQAVAANGTLSLPEMISSGYTPAADGGATNDWLTTPYFDGRIQLKQNLVFLLRNASTNGPFSYLPADGYGLGVTEPSNYAYAGFYNTGPIWNGYETTPTDHSLDVYRPFEENYLYRNFQFDSANLDSSSGNLTTGVSFTPPSEAGQGYLVLSNSPAYLFQPPSSAGTSIPPQLTDGQPLVIFPYESTYPEGSFDVNYDLAPIGISYTYTDNGDGAGTSVYSLQSSQPNFFGLPFGTAAYEYFNFYTSGLTGGTISPGGSVTENYGYVYFYSTAAQTEFQTVEYDFWDPTLDSLPGDGNFSPTNISRQPMIVSANSSGIVAGYSKLALENGYSGTYGYLGQYFDRAYQIDATGNVTTNSAGIISPYGRFAPSVTGPAALVTMADPDTGERGTDVVYAIKLQLDVDHDGKMDLSSSGPDNTFQRQPYTFWCNNNYDRWDNDYPFGTPEQDDQETASQPDCNYTDAFGNRLIPCTRDLEDFARLWLCGMTSNLLAQLPLDASVTLSMNSTANELNDYDNGENQPAIDLFLAADSDGGIGYLTNATIAAAQTNIADCPYVGRLGPSSSIRLNTVINQFHATHFIWCGVSNGIGQVTLTISEGTNILGQTSTYIQIQDIKQMYERYTVGDNPSQSPAARAVLTTEGLQPGASPFTYPPPTITNTPYMLLVHGYNMAPWEKDSYAETAYKRLYWQGYQGRFGSFQWPTAEKAVQFGPSEIQAWQSAQGLLYKLNDLNATYPGQVYLMAHSLGNVVAGEALRLAGSNQVVNTYAAFEAAVTAHAYDPNTTLYTLTYDSGTPDRYAYYYTNGAPCYFNGISGAGNYVNFFNPNDFALRLWLQFQNSKPFLYPTYYFAPPDLYTNYTGSGPVRLFFPGDTYQLFTSVIQARSYPLGAQTNVSGVFDDNQIYLPNVWPPDANGYQDHIWHSSEFRSDNVQMGPFWNQVLIQLKLKQPQP